eukprot:7641903-Pyramimonas_sp.AAC.1
MPDKHSEGPRAGPPTSKKPKNCLASAGEPIRAHTNNHRQPVDLQTCEDPLADGRREVQNGQTTSSEKVGNGAGTERRYLWALRHNTRITDIPARKASVRETRGRRQPPSRIISLAWDPTSERALARAL